MRYSIQSISVSALDAVRCSILISEAQGGDRPIVYANPESERLVGYSKGELLGRDCRMLQNDDRDQPALESIWWGLKRNQPVRAVLRNYRSDGSMFFNDLLISPIRDGTGKTTHFIARQNAIPDPHLVTLEETAKKHFAKLRRREKQVFNLVVRGYTNKEIARILELSPRTVEKHRLRMQRKFDVKNQALLIRYAIALGVDFTAMR